VVIAGAQTAGRGRLGRSWDSPKGLGLYLSILLRPAEPPEHIGRYAIAAAVATCTACRVFAGPEVVLKWPNDLLAGGRKLAGILAELRQGTPRPELVVGIGVNVNHAAADFPESLAAQATSLSLVSGGGPLAREDVAYRLLSSLGATFAGLRAGGWDEVVEQFLRYAPDAVGRRVRVATGGTGVTAGLHTSGALAVQTDDGIVLAHASESVTPVEE
jgi:BirA family biotin operon repressor/biotin-[acetyl-CoA-carboxylase] ligase